MCLIHDFGEALTGDIPAFCKTQKDELDENAAIKELLALLPYEAADELSILFSEMNEQRTDEAKLYKSLDNLEALISHNEADISTWIPLEYEENITYGQKNCEWSAWTKELREIVKQDSVEKIKNSE